MTDATIDELEHRDERKAKKRKGGHIPMLPDFGVTVSDLREWLTVALMPAPGYRVTRFLRHGRQPGDTCTLVLVDPEGRSREFDLGEQRHIKSPSSLDDTLIGATDALCRPRGLRRDELKDIWTGLVMLATVTANQSRKDETRDWLEQTIENAEPFPGFSLVIQFRPDAITAMLERPKFDYVAARRYTDPSTIAPPRPTLLVDRETGEQWMRVGDLAMFWRHVIGTGPMSQPTIDGRLDAIGVRRHVFASRGANGSTWRLRLYRLAEEETAE